MPSAQDRRRSWRQRRGWLLLGCIAIAALAVAFLLFALQRPRYVIVRADGQEQRLRLSKTATVAQALDAAGVTVGPLDRVSPPITTTLSSTIVAVVRVRTSEAKRSVAIPFPSLSSNDARRPRGYRQIVQAGAPGIREIRELVTTEDGVEAGRSIVSDQIIREPVPERVIIGARDDPALDAFRESALGYLGRGGVTRLSPSVVEQTVFELARLRGHRYGSTRVLTMNGRPWLVLSAFARSADDVALFVFWWTDELHAHVQALSEGLHLLDARAEKTSDAIELGLIATAGQGADTLAPQFILYRLPQAPQAADTWQPVWTSQGLVAWRSNQGAVTFGGAGLSRLDVRGASSAPDSSGAALVDCLGCPRVRFESVWQRQDDAYVAVSKGIVASPYATLWAFAAGLRIGSITSTLHLISDTAVLSTALQSGLARPDLQWTASGRETDSAFELRSKGGSLLVTLAARGNTWVIAAIGPVPAQGRILFTGTRPIVRGLFSMDTGAVAPPRALGEGQRYVWSPDYAQVAYDWQGRVYIAQSDGGNQRTIGVGQSPAWSPDGRGLAFERPSNKGSLIVIVNVEDGSETILVGGSQPTWAPDTEAARQRIAYTNSSGAGVTSSVYVIDPATGITSLLASDGSSPLWSPDGASVALLTSRQEIAVVNLAPGRVNTVGAGWGYTWSADGRQLAFLSNKPAGRPMVWNRESEETRALLDRADVDGLSWSPDGREVVISIAGGGGLWLAASDGANLRKLSDGRDPVWARQPRAGR